MNWQHDKVTSSHLIWLETFTNFKPSMEEEQALNSPSVF